MSGFRQCRAATAVAAVAAAVAIAACGGSSHKSSSTSSSASSSSTAAVTSSSTTAATTTASTTAATTAEAAATWSLPNATTGGTRDVVSSINSSNVSKLKVAWTIPLVGVKGFEGVFASSPVFGPNGIVYLQDLSDSVYAVNLKTGKQLWKYNVPAAESNGEGPNGVTLVDNKVYGETNTQAFALQASTGEQLWKSSALAPPSGKNFNGQGFNIAPQVVDGKVFLSDSGEPHGGFAYALDAKTGKIDWKFQETKEPSQRGVGGPSGTGGAWGTPVVANGLVYFGIANPYRSLNQATKTPNDVLYNDSTVALDVNTGKLKWYFQGVPNDFYDWDMQIGPMYTASGPGGQPTVIDAGKMGYVYAMNATTGKLTWKTAVGRHNGHDNDGVLAQKHKLHLKLPYKFCPGFYGGVETQMALAGGVVYAAANNLCATETNAKLPSVSQKLPSFTTGTGNFEALSLNTGKVMWNTKLPSSPYGAATVTNDLVFTTLFNGKLIAMNRSTGKIVWQQQLAAGTNTPVSIDGDTLVTAASFPSGKGQKPEIVAYSLSAPSTPATASTSTTSSSAAAGPAATAVSAKAGMKVFDSTCASCHTLAAAGSTGTVGPNLDQLKPSNSVVVKQVTNGGGGMPAFGSSLSTAQIQSVALFVSSVAGKPVKGKVKSVGGGGP
jgi:outer membrane protein assembly factor BamB/mono/diheme cytochrome c family protein